MTATTRCPAGAGERRSQLLDLGVRLLATRSLDELSIDLLAEEAGISRGLLYHYFGNKHAFHEAVVRRAADDLIAQTAPPPRATRWSGCRSPGGVRRLRARQLRGLRLAAQGRGRRQRGAARDLRRGPRRCCPSGSSPSRTFRGRRRADRRHPAQPPGRAWLVGHDRGLVLAWARGPGGRHPGGAARHHRRRAPGPGVATVRAAD